MCIGLGKGKKAIKKYTPMAIKNQFKAPLLSQE
jgi:hypothetical protein